MEKVKRALISVYHKEGLDPVVNKLHELGVSIVSTGGTYDYIASLGIPVTTVESYTGYPSILGGRVKTLHPSVMGGILFRRNVMEDIEETTFHNIVPIDMVIVDLYPFEETVKNTENKQLIIEKIDIGGISLIRAAAKNHSDVVVVSSREQYPWLLSRLEGNEGIFSDDDRKYLAAYAFYTSAHYDSAIFKWMNGTADMDIINISYKNGKSLRYGENPHQKGIFFGDLEEMFDQIHGKAISYNNLLDIDAAVALIKEFDEPTFAILKHNNACGIAS
ncbi:MAG: bifunctional phosphoribosylaminoimidazolecarboxamide formyltransferase/IMP cyclohydrolase PurH, partial [Bacteroidales bacterium]|nr:bifunctional phosphoribosylaminoimidazolecarboxamide formyltransferase/IMP cyclohydrolase PurH [Bacteroidales bacterium]